MPTLDDILAPYNRDPDGLAEQYESKPFEELHADALGSIPKSPGRVLDVGAGSGRDADWFSVQGFEVVAVEPAEKMRETARQRHTDPRIRWLDDTLPGLNRVGATGLTFDLIWISAVWMHIRPEDRPHAFRVLAGLLRPGGRIMISVRQGPNPPDRVMFPTASREIEELADRHGLSVILDKGRADRLGRDDVFWKTLIVQW